MSNADLALRLGLEVYLKWYLTWSHSQAPGKELVVRNLNSGYDANKKPSVAGDLALSIFDVSLMHLYLRLWWRTVTMTTNPRQKAIA